MGFRAGPTAFALTLELPLVDWLAELDRVLIGCRRGLAQPDAFMMMAMD
jgi:hypothetical protein